MSRCWLWYLMIVLVTGWFPLQSGAATEGRTDLFYRELLYYQEQGNGFRAISRYQNGLDNGVFHAGQEKRDTLAAQLYASWGLFDEAKEYYASSNLSGTSQQRAVNWLSLGKAYYNRQQYAEAQAAFEKIGIRQLPKELEYERLLLSGVSLYQMGNFAGSASALWSIHPSTTLYPFARINIGMGSIKIGSWPGGISGLSSIKKRIGIDVESDSHFAYRLKSRR